MAASNTPDQLSGALQLVLANCLFCGMVCLLRCIPDIDPTVAASARFLFGIILVAILVWFGTRLTFNDKSGIFYRGLLGGIATYLGFYSVYKLGIVTASLFNYTYPVFAALFGTFILGEKIRRIEYGAGFIAIMGIITLIAGGKSWGTLFNNAQVPYQLIALLGAVLGGIAVVYVKKLNRTETTYTIFAAQCLGGLLAVGFPATRTLFHSGIPDSRGMVILLAMGLTATLGQLIFTRAVSHVSMATGSVVMMSAPIINVLAGVALFNERITASLCIGGGLICAGCLVLMMPGNAPSGTPAIQDPGA